MSLRLCVSHIAWAPEEETSARDILKEFAVDAVEIAPSRINPRPLEATGAQIEACRRFWREDGISVIAMQALLFGSAGLSIFETPEPTLNYLDRICAIAAAAGAGPLVFGSPKNRRRNDMPPEEAFDRATRFFRAAGDVAAGHGVQICIEPNPAEYDCDFIQTAREAAALVRETGSPGFGLHLDTSSMTLNGEDYEQTIMDLAADASHFHISEPFLAPVGAGSTDHRIPLGSLKRSGYSGAVSIEMRSGGEAGNLRALRRALEYIRSIL